MLIAHLSDIHINTASKKSHLQQTKFLLKYALKKDVDHIVITGDLSDDAQTDDFEALRKLFIELNILNAEKLTVIIGNHDIFGGPQKAEDIFTFPDRCKKVDYNFKVNEFNYFFRETFENCLYKSKNNSYPFAKIIKHNLFIGINSILPYSFSNNPLASNGKVDIEQLNEIFNILNDFGNDVENIIILIHHQFNKLKNNSKNILSSIWQFVEKETMKLRKKKRLLKLFNNFNIDLVLHGHTHEYRDYTRKGIRFINGGDTIRKSEPHKISLNLIDIKDGIIQVENHKLNFKKKSFIVRDNTGKNKLTNDVDKQTTLEMS